jgi:hypothetical protein
MMSQHYGSPAITVDWESLTDQQKAIIERGPRQTQLVPQMGDAASGLGCSLPNEMVAVWRGTRGVSEILGADDWHRRLFASRGHWSGIGSKALVQDIVITGPAVGIEHGAARVLFDVGMDYIISTEPSRDPHQPQIADALSKVAALERIDTRWDDAEGQAPSLSTIATAQDVLLSLAAVTVRERLPWISPHISATPFGDVTFEWWRDEKQLAIYVSGAGAEFIRTWGEGGSIEMDEADAMSKENQRQFWAWLTE